MWRGGNHTRRKVSSSAPTHSSPKISCLRRALPSLRMYRAPGVAVRAVRSARRCLGPAVVGWCSHRRYLHTCALLPCPWLLSYDVAAVARCRLLSRTTSEGARAPPRIADEWSRMPAESEPAFTLPRAFYPDGLNCINRSVTSASVDCVPSECACASPETTLQPLHQVDSRPSSPRLGACCSESVRKRAKCPPCSSSPGRHVKT